MNEKAYCYRKFWKKPITVHKIGKGEHALIFSRGLEVRQIIVALLLFLITFMFRGYINAFIPRMFQFVVYALIPWFIAGWVVKSNVEGKRLDRYLLGSLFFLQSRKITYSSFKPIYKPKMKKQSYEKFKG